MDDPVIFVHGLEGGDGLSKIPELRIVVILYDIALVGLGPGKELGSSSCGHDNPRRKLVAGADVEQVQILGLSVQDEPFLV